jgi:hypothetical protein
MGADGQPAAAPPVLASSASGGGSFRMIVGCGKKTAVLMASSRGERDEWVQAIGSAIAARKRRAGPADERHKWASNSEWIERFFATMDAQKTRRVHRAHQQRREWRRRWGVHGSGSSGVYDGSGVHEDDGSGGQEQEVARREQREDSREDDDVEEEASNSVRVSAPQLPLSTLWSSVPGLKQGGQCATSHPEHDARLEPLRVP